MSKLTIHQYTYMSDNYGVLLHDASTGETSCIDCGDTQATLAALDKTGWSLSEIWVTHHHADHTAGVVELKAATNAKVSGPNPRSQPIEGVDTTLDDGDTFTFAGVEVQVIHTPGHTKDMINFYLPSEGIAFTGDTLFTMGCGRLFECDAAVMHKSLNKLTKLPTETKIYSSHEYTLANVKFALSVDPDNAALVARAKGVESLRAAGQATVPTTLQEELDTNPFLRFADTKIRNLLGMQDSSDEQVLAEIRQRKDNF